MSTTEQAQEGFSLPAQLERLRAYCASQDWEVTDIYTDEGESAKSTDRPELQRLLGDIKMRKIGIVLVYRLDRLTRSVLDLYELLQVFDKHDVGFKSATEVFDTTTAMGRLFITIVAALAQWERENLGERVKFGNRQKALSGQAVTPKSLFGYGVNNGKFVINENEAEIIREIFQRYLSGEGMHRLFKWLNDPDCPRLGRKKNPWSANALYHVLMNPFYAGYIRYDIRSKTDTLVIKGEHEPIISNDTFKLAQEIRTQRATTRRGGSGHFPLVGLLRCHCGAAMIGHQTNPRKDKLYRYYQCANSITGLCEWKSRRADDIEKEFIDSISRLIIILSLEENLEVEKPKKNTKKQLEQISVRKKRLWDAYEAGLTSMEDLRERLAKLNKEETELQSDKPERDEGKKRQELIQSMQRILDFWDVANDLEQKELARLLVRRIDISKNGELSILLKD